uniref:Uncharacterized protein n=1 Tax=Arundo donax TaxID=35708 RepID=A0A0A9ETE4_ARUDO
MLALPTQGQHRTTEGAYIYSGVQHKLSYVITWFWLYILNISHEHDLPLTERVNAILMLWKPQLEVSSYSENVPVEVPWHRAALLRLPEVHGQGVVIYLKVSNLFLILNNQLLQLLKLLVSFIVLLLAFMLYCNCFLQNSIFPNDSFKLFLTNRIFLLETLKCFCTNARGRGPLKYLQYSGGTSLCITSIRGTSHLIHKNLNPFNAA